MKIEILEGAQQDLLEGAAFYDSLDLGLGSYFLDCLISDIDSLVLFGGTHAKVHGYHRSLSKRFPFAIYYLTDGTVIRVVAVLDCRRRPAWIRKRIHPNE